MTPDEIERAAQAQCAEDVQWAKEYNIVGCKPWDLLDEPNRQAYRDLVGVEQDGGRTS